MENYSIVIIQEYQYESLLQFLFEDFSQRERMCLTSGLSSEIKEKGRCANRDVELTTLLQKKLSLIAIDKRDNLIVGICFNIAVQDLDDKAPEVISNTRQVIQKFVATLEEGNRPSEVYGSAPKGLHLWGLGVKEIHSGKGLARKMVEKTIELAQQQGFTHVESIATSPATRHLFESIGFEVKSNMKLKDFVVDGNKPGFPYASSEDSAEFTIKFL